MPNSAVLLTGGVDVQADLFYWTIRAWAPFLTSWNVAHGVALSWDQIDSVMNTEWRKASGESMQVTLVGVDSGNQTDEVYDFCALNAEWAVPVKGSSHAMLSRFKVSVIDRPSSKANGMRLVLVDGGQYKDMIASRLRRPNGKGSWMVYKDCDAEYADQICSEEKVADPRSKDGSVMIWHPKSSHAANHYLDAEVYAAAAADLLHVRYMEPEASDQAPAAEPARHKADSRGFVPTGKPWLSGGKWL